jgi:hypothetical protein
MIAISIVATTMVVFASFIASSRRGSAGVGAWLGFLAGTALAIVFLIQGFRAAPGSGFFFSTGFTSTVGAALGSFPWVLALAGVTVILIPTLWAFGVAAKDPGPVKEKAKIVGAGLLLSLVEAVSLLLVAIFWTSPIWFGRLLGG